MGNEKRSLTNPGCRVPSWKGVMSKAIIHPLYIHMLNGYDTRVRPCGMSKVMNNLILGECAHTFTDLNFTWKDVVVANFVMKFLMAMPLITKELKKNVLKENVLVKEDSSLQPVGQLSNIPPGFTMTWLGVELPPDENGFHKLDGKYHTIFTWLPATLLKSFLCHCKTDY